MSVHDIDDLPDDLPEDPVPTKKGAVPVRRTPKQIAADKKRAEEAEAAKQLAAAQTAAQAHAARLAQIVNLHIAGYSLGAIGAQIGASEAEVERMLANDTARYVRTQPALRTYVRNFISGKYSELLEAVWDQATDKARRDQLEHVDRAQRILAQMGRLHGAEAPTQSEVKVEAAPEAVERLVNALAAGQGLGYDTDIFNGDDEGDDVVDADLVHEVVEQSHAALEVSGNALEQPQEGDPDDGF